MIEKNLKRHVKKKHLALFDDSASPMFWAAAEGQKLPEDPEYRKTTIKADSKPVDNNNIL